MPLSLVLAVLLLIPGLALALVPVIPAILYLFVVALGYGILTHFTRLSGGEMVALGAVTILSVLIDHFAGILGAKWGGASRRAALFGLLAAVVGGIVGGPLFSFAGLFVGIFVAEVFQLKPHLEAFRAASGGLIGALVGYVVNILLVFLFFILFIAFTIR